MKKLVIGLVLGVLMCGVAGYTVLPKIKQTAYDSGYNAGNKQGTETGTVAGIAQGTSELLAKQKRDKDSAAMVRKNMELKRAAHRTKRVVKETQNWHVIDGKISEAIPDSM